jgi:hypothetical protein
VSKRLPKPTEITIRLQGRDWYSLKAQARGALMSVDDYVALVLFARRPLPLKDCPLRRKA